MNLAGRAAIDVLGLGSNGDTLRVFPNTGRRNIEATVDTGIVLEGLNLLLNVGDWDADGYGDLMYRVAATGELMLRRGLGADKFAAPVRAATGFKGVTMLAPVGDTTGDGYPDLMGRGADKKIRIYPSNGATGFRASYVAHSPITASRQVGIGLFDGDGAPDNLLTKKDGTVWIWSGNGPGGLMTGRQVGSGTAGYTWFKGIGDLELTASLFDDESVPANPISRRADRTVWRDPASGYVRRNISPANFPSPIHIVEVILPAGASVAYETGARPAIIHQQIWVQEGSIELTLGSFTYQLDPDDCLAMHLNEPTTFRNRTDQPARYFVIIAADPARVSRK